MLLFRKVCTLMARSRLFLHFILLGALGGVPAHSRESSAQRSPPTVDAEPGNKGGDFTLMSVGDLLYSAPMAESADPEFAKVLKLIGSGDAALGNLEVPIVDPAGFQGSGYGHGLLVADPALAQDVKALGFDMVSVANNHSTDWGRAGFELTRSRLTAAGVVHAGGGATLADARAPRFLDTPKGRVALIAAASTFKSNAMALDANAKAPGRPGISVLRTRQTNLVDKDMFDRLQTITGQPGPQIVIGDRSFQAADRTGVKFEMNSFDRDEILKAIAEGKAASDLAVFTIHAHENVNGLDEDERISEPAAFIPELLRDAVDAGADIVVAGGPHSLRGIEIYKGKPIFYGVGVFFLTGQIVLTQETRTENYGPPQAPSTAPARARQGKANPASWYESFVAATTFRSGQLVEVRLYPLDLGQQGDDKRKGVPHLAAPDAARRILKDLQAASLPYNTRISIEGAVGVLRP